MARDTPKERAHINAEMTILDVVSRYGQTETVFKHYDEKAGVCLCCQALFESLKSVAQRYALNLAKLISDLEVAANRDQKSVKTPDDTVGF